VNIGRNDQECGVYKEKCIMRKIRERGEKMRVKVVRVKVRGISGKRNGGTEEKGKRGEGRGTEKEKKERNKLKEWINGKKRGREQGEREGKGG